MMAMHTAPLATLLAAIPSLPRPLLARLTQQLIDRLDDMDGDPDREPEEDRCSAGDDGCGPFGPKWGGRIAWGSEYEEEGI